MGNSGAGYYWTAAIVPVYPLESCWLRSLSFSPSELFSTGKQDGESDTLDRGDGHAPMKISLFIPCYVDQFFPKIGISMIEVLERLGHQVDYPEGQTCCGQPAFNSGFTKEARSVAAAFMDHFANSDVVVVPSGSCCAMVKVFCPELFKDSPQFTQVEEVAGKTWEFSAGHGSSRKFTEVLGTHKSTGVRGSSRNRNTRVRGISRKCTVVRRCPCNLWMPVVPEDCCA